MSEIAISNILKNIYGEGATQSFANLSRKFRPVEHKEPKLLYVDETKTDTPPSNTSTESDVLEGGGRRRKTKAQGGRVIDEATTIFSSPIYVEDDDLSRFIRAFNLAYTMVNARRSAIYVIPEPKVLNSMISDFRKQLDKENIKPGTIEVSKYVATNDFPFKRYIFDWKDKATADDAYHIPADFPAESSKTLIRLNRCNEIFYFKFTSLKDIKASESENFSKGSSLQHIATCMNNVYILRGTIPEAKEKRKALTVTMKKASKKQATKDYFLNLVDQYSGDIDRAGYDFIGLAALHKMKHTPKKNVLDDLVKYYSGNMGHTAFEVLASHQYDDYFDDVYQEEDIFNVHNDLLQKFSPVENKNDINKVSDALKRIYESATKGKHGTRGAEINKSFLTNLQRLYKDYSPQTMKADIACAYYQHKPTTEGVEYALELMDLESEDYDNKTITNSDESSHSYTPLVNNIYNSLIKAPFIGPVAKSNIPLLPTVSYFSPRQIRGGDDKKESSSDKNDSNDSANNDKDDELETFEEDFDTGLNAKSKRKKKKLNNFPENEKSPEDEKEKEEDLSLDYFE
jgi:hypothetical protein